MLPYYRYNARPKSNKGSSVMPEENEITPLDQSILDDLEIAELEITAHEMGIAF